MTSLSGIQFWNAPTYRHGHPNQDSPKNMLSKSCARFIIERNEIRKKQHDFKGVHFECRMVLFYMIWEKSGLFSIECTYAEIYTLI